MRGQQELLEGRVAKAVRERPCRRAMTEKLTCGRLSTFELCSRCLHAAPTAAEDGGLRTHMLHITRVHAKRPLLV